MGFPKKYVEKTITLRLFEIRHAIKQQKWIRITDKTTLGECYAHKPIDTIDIKEDTIDKEENTNIPKPFQNRS